ncbi:DUF4019 domain-containing protein [Tardiphaga sp.]|jgi:hypothetical protein|uniref:DUF4019 domain-containing protein n=1 Tax=Tardiphaga sp. TaxID=1926292 RepID=UPI0037D9DD81
MRFVRGAVDINALLAFIFGIIFVCVILAFARFEPNPTEFSQSVYITVLALASAGVGAVLPGMLQVQFPYARASGALALFLLVYLNRPAIVGASIKIEFPTTSPTPVIQSFLQDVDRKLLDSAFDQMDVDAVAAFGDRRQLKEIYRIARETLGDPISRQEIGVDQHVSPAGFPAGGYRTVVFRTKFASGLCYEEAVVVRATSKLGWKVFRHNIRPTPIPCG